MLCRTTYATYISVPWCVCYSFSKSNISVRPTVIMREISYISGVEGVLLLVFIWHICRFKSLHSECYPTAQREPIYTVQTTASAPSGIASSPMQLPADCNLYHLHCTTAQLYYYCEHWCGMWIGMWRIWGSIQSNLTENFSNKHNKGSRFWCMYRASCTVYCPDKQMHYIHILTICYTI